MKLTDYKMHPQADTYCIASFLQEEDMAVLIPADFLP